mgnify:CR=1 FL=1
MSQARLPRTEPSTELITAHKVNHRAAHVAGRALGIFAKEQGKVAPWGHLLEGVVSSQRYLSLNHGCEGSKVGAIPIEEGMTQKNA